MATSVESVSSFTCTVNGETCTIPLGDILYLESLENYVKVVTSGKTVLTRLTMKEAELRLLKQQFTRISRSHLVNLAHVDRIEPDGVILCDKTFRIGRVYKRYVKEQWAMLSS